MKFLSCPTCKQRLPLAGGYLMNGSLYCPDCLEVDIDLNILNHDLALLAPTTAKRKRMNQAGEAIYRMEPPCLDPS